MSGRWIACAAITAIVVLQQMAPAQVEELRRQLETAAGAERIAVLIDLAGATQTEDTRASVEYTKRALALARELPDREAEAVALNHIGISHYRLAEYAEALEAYKQSLTVAEELGDRERIANALNNTGILHYVWGHYDKALDYYARVLDMRRDMGDQSGLASVLNNLGNVYYATDRPREALVYLDEALALYEGQGQDANAASTLNNIGLAHLALERPEQALAQFQRALAMLEGLADRSGMAFSLNNIGLALSKLDRRAESAEFYRRALDLRREIGDRQGIAIGLHNLGEISAGLGDLESALLQLEEALALAIEIGVAEIERDTYETLAGVHEQSGDPARALRAYQQFKALNDRLLDAQIGKRLADQRALHEVENKDREIQAMRQSQAGQRMVRNLSLGVAALLLCLIVVLYSRYRLKDRANRDILAAHRALEVAQAAREQAARSELAQVSKLATLGELAAGLAHEIKKPLTAILLNAQATRQIIAPAAADAEVDGALDDIEKGADRANKIIKRLRSLFVSGEVLREPVDLNEILREIEEDARADARPHHVELALDLAADLPRISGDNIQLQQVVLNLVHNGAEAAATAPDGPREVRIRTAATEAGGVLVAVRDTGPGLDDTTLARMFDPFFTTKAEGMGMGLRICMTIIEAHGGRLWVTRNPDRGLTVQFTLPPRSATTAT